MTADGIPVLAHDPALNPDLTRSPDGSWLESPDRLIARMSFAELASYDVGRLRPGRAYGTRFPAQVPADGERIPSLAQALAAAPHLRFNLEVKTFPGHRDWTAPCDAIATAVMQVVGRVDATTRVMVESFDWRVPRLVQRCWPAIETGWLTDHETEAKARLWWDGFHPGDHGWSVPRAVRAAAAGTAAFWAPDYHGLDAARIAEAHELGLRVVPWTVNAPSDMRQLIKDGVDGFITDRPDLGLEVLHEQGLEVAASHPPHGIG
jgi:glycerophosphoryl diester phosphodiesterase